MPRSDRSVPARPRRVILDIDFRPVLWGLAPLGDGETRYVQAPSVSASLQAVIAMCDLIVGTEEEFCIASDANDAQTAVSTLRRMSSATLVLKRGAAGCTVYPAARGAAPIEVAGFPIEIFNVLGAGDAFMAGFLSGLVARRDTGESDGAPTRAAHWSVRAMAAHPRFRPPSSSSIPAAGATTRGCLEDVALNRLHRATTRDRTAMGRGARVRSPAPLEQACQPS